MKLDKDNWKDIDLNVDSLWIIGPRATGGKRTNVYHGNFAPQIPNEFIRRYTQECETVLDMFMGSGTTLYECETLNRNFIGFDINQEIIDFVSDRMKETKNIKYSIFNCDVTDLKKIDNCINTHFEGSYSKKIDFLISHPPYLDIIKFTNNPNDLSQISDLNLFLDRYILALQNCIKHLKSKKYFAVVIGDLYRDGEVVPLGFYVLDAIKKNIECKLKGIVVKDMVGNRAKIGTNGIWRYRALKFGYFIFKHEYVLVFQKK